MTFIFTPERDPRREQMATEFNAGDKVRYSNMAMPAEVLSGPHKAPNTVRYLIAKADGNVSLVPASAIERIVPRLDQVAGTLAMHMFGRPFVSLDTPRKMQVARAAANVLEIADRTKGQI
jgi:hypothetical protein